MPRRKYPVSELMEGRDPASQKLVQTLCGAVNRFSRRNEIQDEDQACEVVQQAYAAVADVLGRLDAEAHLLGVPRGQREMTRNIFMREGMRAALSRHDRDCPSCPASDELRQELETS